ncbi:unnamed protein product (macronuclear) [Paramecium tetraurelia]|uniref:Protein kinase domain-containing protein n=1 Tax=Paramecium tetraurelia TaxID=5888 RepID=A0C5G0_PARTE|nr:uncharacterized protein GSPATT00006526001 [Paramecium tetraurelia]CAK66027.1 unnamed protein product [Paramecium tetraurelia]|eukprot:XP_001433424.1 hypothetical protein (macronuclear) [Paramecium tetraurelia strain d4-2]
MNRESNNNFISLFDEPNKPLWQKSKPDFKIYQISSVLTMKKTNSQSIKKGKFFISNEYLVEFDNTYKRHIDLNNIILEQTNQPFTFRLSRNKKQIEFTTNEQEYQIWFQLIKKYAIQRSFNEDYKLLKVQGQGNFAKVYKAIGRDSFAYAVKSFEKKSFKNLTLERDALKLEISIMRKIQFPGIIRLYEVYETEHHIWLVTDYLEGGELFQYLRNQPQGFNEIQVALLMHNLLNSLDYLHSQGIIHRDIKPENLILRSPLNASDVNIADFGLADYYNPEGKYLFKRCGTPGYVAPEILQEKNYDYKVDVFSAGILMFIMLSGQSPFQTKSKNELVIKNYNCEIDYTINNLQQKISPEALQLLMIMLSPNPQSRYTAKQALCHPWFMKCFTPVYQMSPPQLYMPTSMIPQFQHYPDIFARSPIMNQLLNQSISNLSLSGSSNVTPQRTQSNSLQVQNPCKIAIEEDHQDFEVIQEEICQIHEVNKYSINNQRKQTPAQQNKFTQ